tara:strand:+ start:828 stop:1127 length:300 start_codon:yes stop_codon:yes gene_type:complete
MISNFHRTIAIYKAATDRAELLWTDPTSERISKQTAFHYHFVQESWIKCEKGVKYDPLNSKIRGAIAWVIRNPGRQITLVECGQVCFEDDLEGVYYWKK